MAIEKIIIDTDPGIDDAMAILYAAAHPKIEIVGLTSVFGNVSIEVATRNALGLCELIGEAIPVSQGAEKPLSQKPNEVSWEVHGRDGFGDLPPMSPKTSPDQRPAHEFICDTINENPGEITLCPVGPLTNIALALRHAPSIADKVKGVTVMGGSVERGGNVSPFAEANIWNDPHAAEEVFSASWPVRLIGLDVTHEIICTLNDFQDLAQDAPIFGGMLAGATPYYIEFYKRAAKINGCYMHDPAAILSIVEPELFSFVPMPLDVLVDGEEIGRTKRSSNTQKPNVEVAMAVESKAVKQDFLDMIKCSR